MEETDHIPAQHTNHVKSNDNGVNDINSLSDGEVNNPGVNDTGVNDTDSDSDADIVTLQRRVRSQRRLIRHLRSQLTAAQREVAELSQRVQQSEQQQQQQFQQQHVSGNDVAALVQDVTQAAAEVAAVIEAADSAGMQFEPETGLYFHAESGYYWDASRQMYYDGTSGHYLRYNYEDGQYEYVTEALDDNGAAETKSRHSRRTTDELEEGELENSSGEEEVTDKCSSVTLVHAYDSDSSSADIDGSERDPTVVKEISCGPMSPKEYQQPPWLRLLIMSTKVESLSIGTLFVVTIDGGTIGRDSSQQILLNELMVSKYHARLTYEPDSMSYHVQDLGSRNGTFVDNVRLSPAMQESSSVRLHHDSLLAVGSTCLLCHVHQLDDMCLQCDPGHIQALQPTAPSHSAGAGAVHSTTVRDQLQQQRRLVAKRIKQKYGIIRTDGAVRVSSGYKDRAASRRLTAGSSTSAAKTETADPQQPIARSCRGYQMLRGMGWREGSGLGRTEQGCQQPIVVQEQTERRGLGCEAASTIPVDKKQLRKTERWIKAEKRYNGL